VIFIDFEKIEGFGELLLLGVDGNGDSGVLLFVGGMENFLIEELELGVCLYNCFKCVGIEIIGDFVMKLELEFVVILNFGKKLIEEVKEIL